MATRDTGQPASGISRRDFLKASAAATAVVGCGLEFAYDPAKAAAYENSADYTVTTTTCPYCSASCGQRVVVDNTTDEVVDIYGDFQSPMNSGGLCAKGAGSLQLVTNSRRIGAWEGAHPVPNIDGTMDNIFAADGTANGVAYKRVQGTDLGSGVSNWVAMDLSAAFGEIAVGMKAARDTEPLNLTGTCNSKAVAFFGSSHINNEPNNLYRKIVANFGTTNVEHQARI